jgi:hypothetical protein
MGISGVITGKRNSHDGCKDSAQCPELSALSLMDIRRRHLAYIRGILARKKPHAYAPMKRKMPKTVDDRGSRKAPWKIDCWSLKDQRSARTHMVQEESHGDIHWASRLVLCVYLRNQPFPQIEAVPDEHPQADYIELTLPFLAAQRMPAVSDFSLAGQQPLRRTPMPSPCTCPRRVS